MFWNSFDLPVSKSILISYTASQTNQPLQSINYTTSLWWKTEWSSKWIKKSHLTIRNPNLGLTYFEGVRGSGWSAILLLLTLMSSSQLGNEFPIVQTSLWHSVLEMFTKILVVRPQTILTQCDIGRARSTIKSSWWFDGATMSRWKSCSVWSLNWGRY